VSASMLISGSLLLLGPIFLHKKSSRAKRKELPVTSSLRDPKGSQRFERDAYCLVDVFFYAQQYWAWDLGSKKPMSVTQVQNEVFSNAVIEMDNKRFFGCKFANCILRYAGGECEWDEHTKFTSCVWDLTGAAQRTIDLLMRTGRIQFSQGKFSL